MWELLMSAGLRKGNYYYPDSGPGPKNLIAGDDQLGYFGETTAAQLFDNNGLCNELGGYYPGVAVTEENSWLKFYYKKKVLWIAKRAVRSGVTWNELYENGLVYGEHGNGKAPTTTPTDQFRQVAKFDMGRQWSMKVRLPTLMDTDPSTAPGPTTAGDSEWCQLIYRVAQGNYGVTPKWAELPTAGFMVADRGVTTLHGWTMESQTGTPTNKAVAGYFSSVQYRSFEPGNATSRFNANFGSGFFGWRPVLELVPPGKISSPYKVKDQPLGPKQLMIRDAVPQPGILRPQYVHQANWTYGAITVKDPTWALNFARGVVPNTISPDLKAFTISGSYVA